MDSKGDFSDNISQHMTSYMKEAVKDDTKIPVLEASFNRVVNTLKPIGKDVFRGGNAVFSTSLFDCVMLGIGKNINYFEKERTDLVIARIERLKISDNFKKASGSASASKSRIMKRIEVADEFFKP